MTLGKKQEKFSRMLVYLLVYIHSKGYNVRMGHVFRCDDCNTGKEHSVHKLKLAVDINLFWNGTYLTSTEDHREFGEYWESLGGSWGGRFGDGNHYSIEHNGVK